MSPSIGRKLICPSRREDLKLLVGSDGKLIKTREEIDLADAPTAVREAAAKLVPAGGELDDGVDREVTDGKTIYSIGNRSDTRPPIWMS